MRSRSRRWRTTFAIALLSIGLLVLTAWNLTRSTALAAARSAYLRGDLVLCLQHALGHLRRQPWSREAALYAARSLSRLDYAEPAEAYFHRAGQLAQSDQQIRAYGLARGPHPDRAIPVYHEILAVAPDNVTAIRRLAALALAFHNTDELLKLADQLCRTAKGAVIGYTLLGVVYHNDSNPQRAVVYFQQVLQHDPELREMPLPRRLFWTHLAEDLIASGRIDDASAVLSKAVANSPDADLMSRLGHIYLLQGKLQDAERCFQQAMEWDPSDYHPHLSLSQIALQRDQHEEALRYLNQANQLAPLEYNVLYSLASVYRLLGRPADAARVQEAVVQLREKGATSDSEANRIWPRYAL
jgi:tetratricopeptide (TPR) repeat protein